MNDLGVFNKLCIASIQYAKSDKHSSIIDNYNLIHYSSENKSLNISHPITLSIDYSHIIH